VADTCPHFTRQAAKYEHLLELHKDTQKIKRGERFIKYKPSKQHWSVYTQADIPQACGHYTNVMSAVFYALK
jgi:hypothetical protein